MARKKKKQFPEPEDESVDFKTKEFLDVAFDPKQEKSRIITLCGEPDWFILLWKYDDFKIQAKIDLFLKDPVPGLSFQISM